MFESMGKEQEPENVGPPGRKTFSDLPWMWPKSQKRYDHVQTQTKKNMKFLNKRNMVIFSLLKSLSQNTPLRW